jgi:hypothetical protein
MTQLEMQMKELEDEVRVIAELRETIARLEVATAELLRAVRWQDIEDQEAAATKLRRLLPSDVWERTR